MAIEADSAPRAFLTCGPVDPNDDTNVTPLPAQFRYKHKRPKKRYKKTRTYDAVLIQQACQPVVSGDGEITFSVELASATEVVALQNLFCPATPCEGLTLTGYWGDSYDVIMTEFDAEPIAGTAGCRWEIKGKLDIICQLTEMNDDHCNCE